MSSVVFVAFAVPSSVEDELDGRSSLCRKLLKEMQFHFQNRPWFLTTELSPESLYVVVCGFELDDQSPPGRQLGLNLGLKLRHAFIL